MIYVYIKNGGIVAKKEKEDQNIIYDKLVHSDLNIDDNIIYEDGKVIKYEESKQYKIDNDIVGLDEDKRRLEKRLEKEIRKNNALTNDYIRLKQQYNLIIKK